MINQFQISNFKAFSDLQTIPLKPLTVIFGPNSSGKSSVIHSLLLARHGIDEGELDVTYPSIAGREVDLGGFRQYVYRRNPENQLVWVIKMGVDELPDNVASDLAKADSLSVHLTVGIQLDDLGMPVEGARPFTRSCEYRIDGETFLRLTRTGAGRDFQLSQLNREHPVFEPIMQAMLLSTHDAEKLAPKDSELLSELIDKIVPMIRFDGASDFLPGSEFDPDILSQMDRALGQEESGPSFDKLGDLGRSVRLFLPRTIRRIHAAVQKSMTASLQSLTYLGPLRTLPPRHTAFLEPEAMGAAASGGEAWHELTKNKEVRKKVNDWLENQLTTPYRLSVEPFFGTDEISELVADEASDALQEFVQTVLAEISEDELADLREQKRRYEEMADEEEAKDYDSSSSSSEIVASGYEAMLEEFVARAFDSDTKASEIKEALLHRQGEGGDLLLMDINNNTPVSHRDVGIGVSQVLPVLVQAYASKNALVAMEQPEIHLHPALQAELGDVFIESALGENRNRFVLETHSEHLILRILRRIREAAATKNPRIRASDVAVLYVNPSPDGQGAEVYEMEISDEGEILSQWPGGFFPERMNEIFGGMA